MTSSSYFEIQEYEVPAQHVRGYEGSVRDEREPYLIHVARYTPRRRHSHGATSKDEMTLIVAAGIGMIKEIYEPFFEVLSEQCDRRGTPIRSFWIADMGCVGKSAVLNARNLGTEQNWFDHSRDLLAIINHFQKEMPRPLIGLGHSMGGCQIAFLSILHPNLFHTLLQIEPAIYHGMSMGPWLMQVRAMARRKQLFPNRAVAEAGVRKNPFFAKWHPRAIDLLVEHNFVPAHVHDAIGPEPGDSSQPSAEAVVTSTPRAMETSLIARPNYRAAGLKGLDTMDAQDKRSAPDVDPEAQMKFPFYRPEPITTLKMLPQIRPSVCYILGDKSHSSSDKIHTIWLKTTGTGVGGSGGERLGRVVERMVGPNGDHYILLDKQLMYTVADYAADWLEGEMKRWDEEGRNRPTRAAAPNDEKQVIRSDSTLVEAITAWHPKKSPDIGALIKARL